LVPPEILGIVVVRVPLIKIPEPIVEPLPVGNAGGVGLPQSPFADDLRVQGSVAV
jgi:hypothetical protein